MVNKDGVLNFPRHFELWGTPAFSHPCLPEGVFPRKLGQIRPRTAQIARIRVPLMEKP